MNNDYNEAMCKKIEENYDRELEAKDFIEIYFTEGLPNYFKNVYSLPVSSKSPNDLYYMMRGFFEAVFWILLVIVLYLTGVFWIPVIQARKTWRSYKAYQSYLRDKHGEED